MTYSGSGFTDKGLVVDTLDSISSADLAIYREKAILHATKNLPDAEFYFSNQ